jgi:hypothetical protein
LLVSALQHFSKFIGCARFHQSSHIIFYLITSNHLGMESSLEDGEPQVIPCESGGQPAAHDRTAGECSSVIEAAAPDVSKSSERPATVLAQIIVSNVYKVCC